MLSANFKPKRIAAASRGFLAIARLSCCIYFVYLFIFLRFPAHERRYFHQSRAFSVYLATVHDSPPCVSIDRTQVLSNALEYGFAVGNGSDTSTPSLHNQGITLGPH